MLNINNASVEEIVAAAIPGIARARANLIVEHREKAGEYSFLSQVAEVGGLAQSHVAILERFLVLSDEGEVGGDVSVPETPAEQPHTLVTLIAVGSEPAAYDLHRANIRLFQEVQETDEDGETRGGVAEANIAASFDYTGQASFWLPDPSSIRGPVSIAISAPDGSQLRMDGPSEFAASELGDRQKLRFQPVAPYALDAEPERPAKAKQRTRGSFFALNGQKLASKDFVIFGAQTSSPGSSDFFPIAESRTDSAGRFRIDVPTEIYTEAYAQLVLGVGASAAADIRLSDGGRIPESLVLAVDAETLVDEEDDCECNEALPVPRAPDEADLAEANGVYSQDLGQGRCIQFTKPDRVLEEFSFQYVVRSTDPVVQPKQPPPNFNILQYFGGWGSIYYGVDLGFGWSQVSRVDEAKRKRVLGLAPAQRNDVAYASPIYWDHEGETNTYEACTIAHGHILTIKQQWVSDGFSLGSLLYSLPLAPGQKKQIAIVDWERRESAARSEFLTESEEMEASLSRDRDVSDVVKATVTENMSGRSSATSFGLGAGGGHSSGAGGAGNLFGFNLVGGVGNVFGGAVSMGRGSSVANQNSARTVTSSAIQQLRDQTRQSASAVRSRRSTVVQSVTQGERSVAQSESVANYNHCHAVTMQYFEVLRHLLVRQRLVGVQECLFIPLGMEKFDADKALRWRSGIAAALGNSRLRGGLDALDRIKNNYVGSDFPTGIAAAEDITQLSGELTVRFQLVAPDLSGPFDPDWWGWFSGLRSSLFGIGPQSMFNLIKAAKSQTYFHEHVAPKLARQIANQLELRAVTASNSAGVLLPADCTLVTDYAHDVPAAVTIRLASLPAGLKRSEITAIRIAPIDVKTLPAGSRVMVDSGRITYRTARLAGSLFNDRGIRDDLTGADGVYLPTPLSWAERRNPREEDKETSQALLTLLNENIEYFHKAIWMTMSPDRRYMMLDGFTAPNSGGRSVASLVDNRIVGVVGNSIVMPVASGVRLDPTFKDSDRTSLLDHYAPDGDEDPLRIALPTKGVFAESVMGSCNSCEHKEDDRFWRWEESPIPDSPAGIQPLSTETRKSDSPDLTAAPFSPPLVVMQNAPAAPDPQGSGGALGVLGNGALFRDLAGLAGNQSNSIEALKASLSAAQEFGAEAADVAKSFGEHAANMGLQQSTSKDMDRIQRAIQTARSQGLIDDDEAGELTQSALRAMVGQGATAKEGSDAQSARKMLNTIRNAEGEGSIDNEQKKALSERVLGQMAGGSAGSQENVVSGKTVDRLIQQSQPGSTISVKDGDRSVTTKSQSSKVTSPVSAANAFASPGDWRHLILLPDGSQARHNAVQTALSARFDTDDIPGPWSPIQTFEHAFGDGDLMWDYYPVRVTEMPLTSGVEMTAEALLKKLRTDLDSFINTTYATFAPYEGSDATVWASDDPTGAVIHVDAAGLDNFSVVVIEASPTRWVFATVWTPNDGRPVLGGVREFGIKPIGGQDFEVYTRGLDRWWTGWDYFTQPAGGPIQDQLWASLQAGIVQWVGANGGQASIMSPVRGRHGWAELAGTIFRPGFRKPPK